MSIVTDQLAETVNKMNRENQLKAVEKLISGNLFVASHMVDENTTVHGFGKVSKHGTFEFQLPTGLYEMFNDLKTQNDLLKELLVDIAPSWLPDAIRERRQKALK